MPFCDVIGLAHYQNRKLRLMGIDLGEKTIGIALSDPGWQIASPLMVIKRSSNTRDIPQVLKLAGQHQAGGIIIGLPVNMNGSYGPQAEKIRAFAQSLLDAQELSVQESASAPELPIAFWDERLSTMAVNRTLITADMSRKRRSEVVDKLAAAYILQGALDRLRQIS